MSAAGWYLLGASIKGFDWPAEWLTVVGQFSENNYLANQQQQVSFFAFFKALADLLALPEFIHVGLIALGAAISVAVFLIVASRFFRLRDATLCDSLCLMGAMLPAISPQTLFYDLGISLLAVLPFVKLETDSEVNWLVLLVILIGLVTHLRSDMILPPLVVVAAGALFYLVAVLGRPSRDL